MWDIIGQERAISLLQKSLKKDNLANAYLLAGLPHIGKMALAINVAQSLNCESADPPCGKCTACKRVASGKHADVQVVELSQSSESGEGESKTKISVEQVDQILHAVNLAPFEGKYRVFIIDGVEYMSIAAVNRLLKTIEEPTGKVVFILLTADESLVPLTIVSRCQRIELIPVPTVEIEKALVERRKVEPQRAKLLARLAVGCPGWAITAVEDDSLMERRTEWLEEWIEMTGADFDRRFVFAAKMVEKYSQNREKVQQRLDLFLNWWRDVLMVKVGCEADVTNIDFEDKLKETADDYSLSQIRDFVERIQSAKEQLGMNANPQLVMEVLMLNIPEKSKIENPTA
ncbi:MAG: AAA family ATPase [Dehalococcoidales bacterium]|nr:AAA family ATPase [Dehalococcoidales bacterium]